jgi:hypothetical protein
METCVHTAIEALNLILAVSFAAFAEGFSRKIIPDGEL